MSDLDNLPDIQFVETDVQPIINSLIDLYEATTKKKLFPADPERLFLLTIANMLVQERVNMNMAAKWNLLRYAPGGFLDHMGSRVKTPRLTANPAITTVRFAISTTRPGVVTIDAGTRVSPGGDLYFASKEVAEIPAGSLSVDVLCECQQAGVIGNGFLPGQINIIIDPFPWQQSAENITESSGGTEREEDDPYRERIYLAPESFSTAGPEGAYEYYAKSANPGIIDVKAYSPSDGVVEIRPLMMGGEIPTQDILDAVLAACSPKTVRPLTDKVQVVAPTQSAYNIDLTYYISRENEKEVTNIQAAVQAAVDEYALWQKSKLGRDINPDELNYLIRKAGAKRAQITSPVFTILSKTEVAAVGTVTVNYGGLEDA